MNLLTPGRHHVRVADLQIGESSRGTPQIELRFETLDGQSEITGWLYLSDSAFDRTVKVLREVFAFDDDFDRLADQLLDRECSITVEEEAQEKNGVPTGRTRVRVKWINPLKPARVAQPVDGGLLGKLSERAKRIARPADLPSAPPPKAPAPARPLAPARTPKLIDDEDEPF